MDSITKKFRRLTPSKYQDLLDELSGISESEDSDSGSSSSDSEIEENQVSDEENGNSTTKEYKVSKPNVDSNIIEQYYHNTPSPSKDKKTYAILTNVSNVNNVDFRHNIRYSEDSSPQSVQSEALNLNYPHITNLDRPINTFDSRPSCSGYSFDKSSQNETSYLNDQLHLNESLNSNFQPMQNESIVLPSVNNFTGKPGLSISVPEAETPLDFFKLFINRNVLDFLTYETNLYAHQTKLLKPNSHKRWRSITVRDMAQYLGLNILFGVFKLPRKYMYWSLGKAYSSQIVRACMSYNKYQDINTFFHAFNNKAIPTDVDDRLIKVRTLIDYLINRFQTVYTPEKNLSLDEGIMPYKGKLSFKTYQPDKPDSYGIRLYILTEAESGYVYKFSVYTGQGKTTNEIVSNLTLEVKNQGYHLYMDNFYNSVKLAKELFADKIYVCGTLRIKRGAPKAYQQQTKSLKKDEILFERMDNVSIMTWKDKKPVSMISTIHDNANTVPVERTEKKKKQKKTYTQKLLSINQLQFLIIISIWVA